MEMFNPKIALLPLLNVLNGTNGVNGVLVQAVKPSELVHAMRHQLYLPLVANVLGKVNNSVNVLKPFPQGHFICELHFRRDNTCMVTNNVTFSNLDIQLFDNS